MTSRTQSGRQRDVRWSTGDGKKSDKEKSHTAITRSRWELLTALSDGCRVKLTQSPRNSDKAVLVKNDKDLSFIRSLPMITVNLFIRNRWIRAKGWNRLADGVLEKIYVISSVGSETLCRAKEPPAAKTVWYRCDQCGDRWRYRAQGRPPKNCDVCGEKNCMKLVRRGI